MNIATYLLNKGKLNMAKAQPQLQKQAQEDEGLGFEQFMAGENEAPLVMKAPKTVNTITAEQLDQVVGEVDKEGNSQSIKLEKEVIAQLDTQVEKLLVDLMKAPIHSDEMRDITSALNKMGDKEIDRTSGMSNRMLQRPLRAMRSNDAGEGGSIASNLKGLSAKVRSLDPSNRDKLFGRNKLFGIKLPFGIGNKVDSYFQEYKSAESQLDGIVKSLLNGKDELQHDIAEIDVEREQMQDLMMRLEQYAYVMKKLDKRIEEKLPEIEMDDRLKASDIRTEILFPVRQKRMDLLQHMAVCMQGYLALQVVKQNNKELIRGVDRATKTTVTALRTAIMVSEALGTQKLVLDQIKAVDETTNGLIEQNAKMLLQTGSQIQKQATESAVNVQVLDRAFQQIFQAMEAIDTYREQALPNMQKTVDSLEKTVDNAKNYLSTHRQNRIGDFSKVIADEPPETTDKGAVRIRP